MPAHFRGFHGRDCGHGSVSAMRDAYLYIHRPWSAYMHYKNKYGVGLTPWQRLQDKLQGKMLTKADFEVIFENPEFHGNFRDFGIYMNLDTPFDPMGFG